MAKLETVTFEMMPNLPVKQYIPEALQPLCNEMTKSEFAAVNEAFMKMTSSPENFHDEEAAVILHPKLVQAMTDKDALPPGVKDGDIVSPTESKVLYTADSDTPWKVIVCHLYRDATYFPPIDSDDRITSEPLSVYKTYVEKDAKARDERWSKGYVITVLDPLTMGVYQLKLNKSSSGAGKKISGAVRSWSAMSDFMINVTSVRMAREKNKWRAWSSEVDWDSEPPADKKLLAALIGSVAEHNYQERLVTRENYHKSIASDLSGGPAGDVVASYQDEGFDSDM